MARVVNIAKDYSRTLGGRWISLGAFSGEDFYKTLLEPEFLEAKNSGEELLIELDGTSGYPSSFLDQSFGELGRKYGVNEVREIIKFKADTFAWVVNYINQEIWDKTK